MAIRFYLVPKDGDGTPLLNPFRPKYLSGLTFWAMDYGREPFFLAAADVTDPQHTAIVANADVSAFPQNLDAQVGANLAATQAALETRNMPGSWVQSTHTFRNVLRGVATLCRVAQRYDALFVSRIFQAGLTLDTTVSQLTQTQRDRLQTAATVLGVDYSSVTGATTLRQVLRVVAQQLGPMTLAEEALM